MLSPTNCSRRFLICVLQNEWRQFQNFKVRLYWQASCIPGSPKGDSGMVVSLALWPTRRRSNKTGSRTVPRPFLNDSQWKLIADLFLEYVITSAGGRPPVPPRPCLEGVPWILKSGARWQALFTTNKGPERYPSPTTCWRRLVLWTESGIFLQAWARLLGKLDLLRGIDWAEAIADGTFSPAKKGGPRWARQKRARERS